MMKKSKIIGREREKRILDGLLASKEAEFVALYGRRRVGKTHLIRHFFSEQRYYMEVTGKKDEPTSKQLQNFIESFSAAFFDGIPLAVPKSWEEAFKILTTKLEKLQTREKIVIFLDELPWMATSHSHLIQELDHFWNSHWSALPNLLLIVCGSAASWMLEHLIQASGGLYNRITKQLLLQPYTLAETHKFLKARSISLSQKQLLDIYMVMGGIPHYLKEITKGKSASQNIDAICFERDGLLFTEFKKLFKSLFDHAETHLMIIREIVRRGNSLSREELIKRTKLSSGGTLTKRLEELESSGFIQSYVPYGNKNRDHYYRLVDEYTLFYLKWIEPIVETGVDLGEQSYWEKMINTPQVNTWAGYAFESVCRKHLPQISRALHLDFIPYVAGSWRFQPKKNSSQEGVQIDLLFDRQDEIITLCEMKYSRNTFVLDKAGAKGLAKKAALFEELFHTNKQIFMALVTTVGLKRSLWSEELIQNVVILSDLFVE